MRDLIEIMAELEQTQQGMFQPAATKPVGVVSRASILFPGPPHLPLGRFRPEEAQAWQ